MYLILLPALATKHSPAKINCFNCNCFFLYNLSLGHTSLAAYFDPVLEYKFSLVYFPFHADIYMFVKHRIGSRDYPDIIYPPRAQNFSRLNLDAKNARGFMLVTTNRWVKTQLLSNYSLHDQTPKPRSFLLLLRDVRPQGYQLLEYLKII